MSTLENLTSDITRTNQPTLSRNNNFNLLRLLLAMLVILSHSPELVDGNRHREILTRLFGTVSFGELAVDGFFLLSGFLIVQSWHHNPNFLAFLKKRILRIYPAFIVASLVSAFVVGPLGSNPTQYFTQFNLLQFIKGVTLLHVPIIPPVFEGQPYPYVNNAMWTIKYEFLCYLFVALSGIFGIFKNRLLCLILFGITLSLSIISGTINYISFNELAFSLTNLASSMLLLAFFCAGGCFYLFNDRIRYKTNGVYLAVAILFLCLFSLKIAQFALATFGAYVLFWFAFSQFYFLERFRTYSDISYGVYLYGWPSQKLLLWYFPSLSPWLLFLLACISSCICGFLSWHLIEHPFLDLKRKKLTYNIKNIPPISND